MGTPFNIGLPASYAVQASVTSDIGEFIYLPISYSKLTLTSGKVEYLKSGTFLPYAAKYAAGIKSNPVSGVYYHTAATANLSGWNTQAVMYVLLYGTTNYCLFSVGNGTIAEVNCAYTATTINGTWTAVTVGSANASCSWAMKVGTEMCMVGKDVTTTFGIVESTPNGVAFTGRLATTTARWFTAGAVNTAGTLAVVYDNGAQTNSVTERIYTSTNGTAWTQRTGTGGTASGIQAVWWLPCASAFYVKEISVATRFGKTTDGFTFTDLSIASLGLINSDFDASQGYAINRSVVSSPTATILNILSNTRQAAGQYLHTTDGTTFTIGSLPNSNISIGQGVTINYDSLNSRFVAYWPVTVGGGSSGSAVVYAQSTDGLTWTILWSDYESNSASISYGTAFGMANSKFAKWGGTSAATPTYVTEATAMFAVASPITHVSSLGSATGSTGANGYMRIR